MAAPKFSVKMLIMPATLLLSRQLDMKNEDNIKMAQMVLAAITVLILTLHFLVYTQLGGNKKKDTKIWVPPKAKPVLPFGLGPPAELVKPEEYETTTYGAHELSLLKQSAQGIATSFAISMVMSFKFNVHMSCAIQAVMLPVNLSDNIVLKKYLFGMGGDNIYGEFLEAPTAELIAAQLALTTGEEPQVVELPELVKMPEEVAGKKKSTSCAVAEVKITPSAHEID
jgi:hypothetical protein